MHRQDDLHDDENPPSAPNPPSRRGIVNRPLRVGEFMIAR